MRFNMRFASVPAGVAARDKYSLKTWDRFMIPRLFTRIAVIYGEAIHIPKDLDAAGEAKYTRLVEERMHELNKQAEELAKT